MTTDFDLTLKDDTFEDPAIATCCVASFKHKNGAMTNAVQLLVRPIDKRSDESGAHPGERFVMVTITRNELAAMLRVLQQEVLN